MPSTSIFADEWRDCLRAHYTYVVRMNDKGTERTLRGVMFEAGFNETELKELYVLATAHVDDVSADFVPDMELLESAEPAEAPVFAVPAVAMPLEVIEAALVEESLALDEAAAASSADELDETELDETELDDAQDEPPKADPDITQLSLF